MASVCTVVSVLISGSKKLVNINFKVNGAAIFPVKANGLFRKTTPLSPKAP